MFSTCIFCQSKLGENESVEHFPLGRRLAFDAKRGRLWVVCRRCERWNLSPLEERWEAIEDCERLFANTRLRVSTDNIGLARVGDGLELVRIGEPLRPELAAWRYGDQFGRRQRRTVAYTGAGIVAGVGLIVVGPIVGGLASGTWVLYNTLNAALSAYQRRRVRARVKVPGREQAVAVRGGQVGRVALVSSGPQHWSLRVFFEEPEMGGFPNAFARLWPNERPLSSVALTGDEALRAAARLLPAINATGANRRDVATAVNLISETPDPSRLFAKYAANGPDWTKSGRYLSNLSKPVRLALEMSSHEDAERRALHGELSLLESAWRDAEEIAAIADGLLLPDDANDRLVALKRDARDA